MCKGKCPGGCDCSRQGLTIGQLIDTNRERIAQVFVKYNAADARVNMANIVKLALIYKEPFLRDLADAWMPQYTGYTAEEVSQAQQIIADAKAQVNAGKMPAGKLPIILGAWQEIANATPTAAAPGSNVAATNQIVNGVIGQVTGAAQTLIGGQGGANLGPLAGAASNTTNTTTNNACAEGEKFNPETGKCEPENKGLFGLSTTQLLLAAGAIILLGVLVFMPAKQTS